MLRRTSCTSKRSDAPTNQPSDCQANPHHKLIRRPGSALQRTAMYWYMLLFTCLSSLESLPTSHAARLQFFCDRLLTACAVCVLVWLLRTRLRTRIGLHLILTTAALRGRVLSSTASQCSTRFPFGSPRPQIGLSFAPIRRAGCGSERGRPVLSSHF